MGSPSRCYKEILQEFVLSNHRLKKDYNAVEIDINNKSIEELEKTCLDYYNKNKDYAVFMMGACVQYFLDKYDECNDIVNASAGAISQIFDLFNIKDDEEFIEPCWKVSTKYTITGGGNPLWVCSNCGYITEASLMPPKHKYCPNCGVKMKGN